MIIDLSLPVYPDMPVYPGDRNIEFTEILTHKKSGYCVHYFSTSTHAGTHIDAPFHTSPEGDTVDTGAVLSACIGEALVINVSDRLVKNEIMPSSLGTAINDIHKEDRVLLATGWSENFGKKEFFKDYPSLSEELTDILIERSVLLVGLETPSVHSVKEYLLHSKLLSAGIIIVENMANLKTLSEGRVFFSAAPLRLEGIDASPVRAYAIL